jgi:uncharacterized protein YaeQ
MALKATIFKTELQITDLDRDYYQAHTLTLARHPSETDERMMVRLLAFARHASGTLAFTRGLSTAEEPDVWQHNPAGDLELWIELGQPDEKRIRKACSLARQVCIYCYSGHSAALWWERLAGRLDKLHNLTVINLPPPAGQALASLAQRSMQLQCTIQDGQLWLGDADRMVEINPEIWQQALPSS